MPRQKISKLHEASINNDFSFCVKEFSDSSVICLVQGYMCDISGTTVSLIYLYKVTEKV